ncbi:hypothetical protein SBOR_3860 [Sclerotinia borealis F-4128]|uniref:Uncharacterized protein n=1 Tax=Sclerotinia borealis (strain F-4128) TaxID=1432307 RepID=W9CIE0_SCLBF|nr:hypothetical protein SBOR_3860 [Sclerotinia borealis F-4128]
MDPYGKQPAPARPATNFDNNIRLQSSFTSKRNDSLQAQSEDNFDESSSTTSLSTISKVIKCLISRWHASCHNPYIEIEETLDWRCARCVKKYVPPSKEPPSEEESLGSVCEIPGCNKTIYSMFGRTKLDRVLCKHHEMTERSEKSKLATKAQISALSRPVSKLIKKSKLYPVKYDEDMQGMKRKPGRKPGDMKSAPMPLTRLPVQPAFNNEPTARPGGISKLENILAARSDLHPQPDMAVRGALRPRTNNSARIPISTSITQSQSKSDNSTNTIGAFNVPKLQNRTIPSPSPEYEPPSPANFDDNTIHSPEYEPEYEPPSPVKVDNNANFWQSDVGQDDSPGSQIKDEFRAMQENAKNIVTESASAFAQGIASPFVSPSHARSMPESIFAFVGSKKPVDKTPLLGSEKAIRASSTVPYMPLISDVSSTTNTLDALVSNTTKDVWPPDLESSNRQVLRLAKKRKASPQEDQEAEPDSAKQTVIKHLNQQNLNDTMNALTTPQPQEKFPEPEPTAPELQQKGPKQKETNHTAPLYGDYKPHTIEYQRQIRAQTYDPSVLDHYLNLQMKYQARAEVEREQNITPQADIAAKTQIWGTIDPRIVWPKEQPEGWYEAKRKEIDARGGKKARFGILLTAQVRKERSDRGWHPNQNKDYVPKEERNDASIFVANEGNSGKGDLAIKGGKLGVLVPVKSKEGKVKAKQNFFPG